MTYCVISHGKNAAGEHRTVPSAEGLLLCNGHATKLGSWLRDIAVDYALLPTVLMPGSGDPHGKGGGKPKKGAEAPSPASDHVIALRDNGRGGEARDFGDELWYELPDVPGVISVVHAWAEQLRCDLDPTSGREPNPSLRGATVTGEINYLLAAHTSLCGSVWIPDAYDQIKRCWSALQGAHGRPRPQKLGTCLEVDCGGTVWPRDKDQLPWCSKCKREYGPTDMARLAVTEAKAHPPKVKAALTWSDPTNYHRGLGVLRGA